MRDITENQPTKALSESLRIPRFVPVSPFRQIKQCIKEDLSPLASRQNNLGWVTKIIAKPFQMEREKMKLIY
jgi:hypothetical protein